MRIPTQALFLTLLVLAGAERLPSSAGTDRDHDPDRRDPMQVYTQHCAACHGERGRGDGPAARFLDPPPRDFTSGAFRIVSTTNGIPSDKDLFETIAAGLPGTAMVGHSHLGWKTVQDLVEVVRGFHRAGVRERLREDAEDEAELETWVREETAPGPLLPIGEEPPDGVESQARGLLLFQEHCAACHGADARGAPMKGKKTSEGHPVQPRDITRGVLKAGWDGPHLFRRIRLGMPGSPMPALTGDALDDRGVWDLVHYLATIIPGSASRLHDPVKVRIPVRKVARPLPLDPEDPRFQEAPEVPFALAPFQAHDPGPALIAVRALHDGDNVVFRLRIPDATWNGPGSPDPTPPDGVAVRITHLKQPSIMPMPGLALPLDRGLWTAGPLPGPEDPVYSLGGRRFENPDEVCRSPLRPQEAGGGRWKNNLWTVVLPIRPMKAGRITSGGTMPASFAVFDGSKRRGPMPVAFSHWHTLVFE